MSRIALAALLAFVGCAAPPPALVEGRQVAVRAASVDEARGYTDAVDDWRPRLAALVPGLSDADVEVWIEDTPTIRGWRAWEGVEGWADSGAGRVHVRRGTPEATRATILHELVHLLQDETWERLPVEMQEGFADAVPELIDGELAGIIGGPRLMQVAHALSGFGWQVAVPNGNGAEIVVGLDVTVTGEPAGFLVEDGRVVLASDRWFVVEAGRYASAYVLARRIIERRGIDGLRRLCVRAREEQRDEVPWDWLHEAAELDTEPESWRVAIDELLGPAEMRRILRVLHQRVVPWVAPMLGSLHPGLTGEEVLARLRPELRLVGLSATIPLADLPGAREELLAALTRD